MRDVIVLAIILGAVPICLISPYFGILMWYWVTYFNPHRFTWAYAYNFPVAMAVAVPTLGGLLFAKKSLRSLFTIESLLLMVLWAWLVFTYIHAQGIPLFAGNMASARYEMDHISKILMMTLVMILVVTSKQKLRGVMLVTGLSLGLLAVKGAIFGARTGGEYRVWGPPDSFLSDNNAFGLALNMAMPILFYLAREEKRRWIRYLLWICFFASILSVLLTYSRGGLLGLAIVMLALTLRSKHKMAGATLLGFAAFSVLIFAPDAWMGRMDRFFKGDLDSSAEQRLVAWGTAWNLARDYPITGGSFDVLPNVSVFQRYEPRSLPLGYKSTAPHSIYFQLLADQGFVGLGLFLLLLASCFWSLTRMRRRTAHVPECTWIRNYSYMIEVSILAFMTSGAFLGFVYLDVIYQMIGAVSALKVIAREELAALTSQQEAAEGSADVLSEEVPQPA